MSYEITKKQQAILDYIKSHTDIKGFPPSYVEIGNKVGLSSRSTVSGHIERLEKKGLIKRYRGIPRSLVVIDRSKFVNNKEKI